MEAEAEQETGRKRERESSNEGSSMETPEAMEAEEMEAEQETGTKRDRESSDEESSDDESSGEEDLIARQRAALYKKLGFVEGSMERAWIAESNTGREERARPNTSSVGASKNRYACLMRLDARC